MTLPLYEYECVKCQHRFEKIQSFSAPPVRTCPKCKGKVRKLLSAPAIRFKGQGWYITDYARKPEGADKESGDKESADKESGDKESGDTAKKKASADEKSASEAKPAKSAGTKGSSDKKS